MLGIGAVMGGLSAAGNVLFGGAFKWATVTVLGLGLATFATRSLLDAGEARCEREHLIVAVRSEQIGRLAERRQTEELIENERDSYRELDRKFKATEQEMAALRQTARSTSNVCVSREFLDRLRSK